ncbi:MAG: hypothetical protein PHP98_09900 [Kiritimatiellae bacterium]|nr:hypothetical protein [Kiritimatiellia bacterium]
MLPAGCSSVSVEKARANFYTGRFVYANENLKDIPTGDKDEILYLSERGMIRQAARLYEESSLDWRRATEINDSLPEVSLSKSTAGLLVNDRVLTYRGLPFERTLIYTFLAKNYFAQQNWDYAAVCARNIIGHLENLDGFPDMPYSRYLAGFGLEMINDYGNAAIQYKAAGKRLKEFKDAAGPETLAPAATNSGEGGTAALVATEAGPGRLDFAVEPDGRILSLSTNANAQSNSMPSAAGSNPCQLVCFIGIGKMPKWCGSEYDFEMAPFAEIYHGDQYLGRSYPFGNTATLMIESKNRLAALQAAKTGTRVVIKEVISGSVESQNEALGAVTRLILFSLEQPDTRCWETLPLWLEIARVPCSPALKNYRIVFKSSAGAALKSKIVTAPIARRGNIFVSFCRDLEEDEVLSPHP